jgi:hypothetical protein
MTNSIALKERKKIKLPEPPEISGSQLIFFFIGLFMGYFTHLETHKIKIFDQLIEFFSPLTINTTILLVLFLTMIKYLSFSLEETGLEIKYHKVQLESLIGSFITTLGYSAGMLLFGQKIQTVYLGCMFINLLILFTVPNFVAYYAQFKQK